MKVNRWPTTKVGPPRSSMAWAVAIAWWLCGASVPAQDAAPQDAAPQEVGVARLPPLDFSQPPVLPQVDGPRPAELESAIERGVDFLIADQNANGSWGSATNTKDLNIFAPVPGAHHAFRTATTALCLSALLEVADEDPQAQAAIELGEAWLVDQLPRLRRATGTAIYNVWGHAYAIQALLRLRQYGPEDAERRKVLDELIRSQFDMLTRFESVDGGWGYYDFRYQARRPTSDSISFVNGAVLIAFAEARQAGLEPPEAVTERAIAATVRQQRPDFAYLYGEYLKDRPMRGINRPGGSLGRSQCCNAALRMWGKTNITDNVLKHWLYRLYERNGWLDIGRKRPIPHESWFQVAGYFYYFGHYYAGYCIELLPEEDRPPYQAMVARLILDKQEKNGCWWDYPLYDYHQQYGTAMALMTLKRCRPQ
ncbi:prenyltransferase/squalene oxidase repeat-containing protein [Roseimaritima sediminicola]|uniref:prenyltransferase/squalene oxidase repeat-containing protein n=1 Tax=Roseimaritima sediminicola TaxID=2662066 RepID=UPI00192A3DE2|nr:prenyltransferase/squalene oxidase repeat-containing protein [Roseimaritima sediminicola]